MSIVGTKYRNVWFLDPAGGIAIALLILISWASTAFEHMWFLAGKSAPQNFLNKLVYVSITHDPRIQKIDTVSQNTCIFILTGFDTLLGTSIPCR
jgi:divalent metal cation (Fe/Co/Zn/Cd) transporter